MKLDEVTKLLGDETLKLEEKYGVRVSMSAVQLAIKCFNFKLIPGDKKVDIFDEACKLVLEKFRNCDYESKFHQKAYELHRALVELNELKREKNPDSQSWLKRVKQERDSASIYMGGFLEKWERVLMSSRGDGILTPACAEKLNLSTGITSKIVDPDYGMSRRIKWLPDSKRLKRGCQLTTTLEVVVRDISQFLDNIQGQLIECFQHQLTVNPCHVAEVVSRLTDVPLTQILPHTDRLKEKGKYKTKQWVVDQDHVIDQIFDTLGSEDHMPTRPRGSFLLLGPPGVGKTEIAKAVTEHWYCDVGRLVKIDMSEYAEPQLESTSCDLLEWTKEKRQNLWNRLLGAVERRPFSVILLDKIDKAAASVAEILVLVLNNHVPSSIIGKPVDFSKSIIFMASSVGTDQLERACTCFDVTGKRFNGFTKRFCETHGYASERVVYEARKFFSSDLVDSFNKVIVMEKFRNQKAVARLLLREIAREDPGKRIVVHASDAALSVLLEAASTESVGPGTAIKRLLHERVIQQLSAAEGYNSVVYVDALFGIPHELSFRYQKDRVSMVDRYFRQKNGMFGKCMANLRMKVESVYNVLELRRKCLPLLAACDQNLSQLRQLLLSICNSVLLLPPCPNSPTCAFKEETLGDKAPNSLYSVEEKKKIKDRWITLQENIIGGVAKATCFILDTVLKVIDAPSELPDSLSRHYFFLGLDDDAREALTNGLTESLGSSSAKSLFTHVKLDNSNRSGEIQRKLIIEEVKEKPCMVLLFDGVEFADEVLYRTLLEIFDEGTLSDGEGFAVDFQKTIVILTSAAFPKDVLAGIFNYHDPRVLSNIGTNEIVRQFGTELLYRVDEIVYFDPLLPSHGDIIRSFRRDRHFLKKRRVLPFFNHLFREIEQ